MGETLAALPLWQARLATMAACTLPGVLLRLSGVHLPPQIGLFTFGGAVVAAAFMLAWAAEAAELDVPPGIAVAGVALLAVLPEYVIEVYLSSSAHLEEIATRDRAIANAYCGGQRPPYVPSLAGLSE